MINGRELFAEISNEAISEGGEIVGYFVKNSRMDFLECLLSAPPAPAVPEEMKRDPDADVFDPGFMNGWNACRAAMLAQPVSSGYKLPEGWIACSERMPDNDETKPIAIYTGKCLGQGMFVATYDEDGFFDYWEGGEIIGVTHWMPLPAAPEGGNG